LEISYVQAYSFAAGYKLWVFFTLRLGDKFLQKTRGWDALVLPASVCFKMLPLPLLLPGLLPPGRSTGVGMQGKQLALWQPSVVADFLKPSHLAFSSC